MIRRRRRVREIHFSFDSFLDVVANVVGIIIRLILVVWGGARWYSGVVPARAPAAAAAHAEAPLPDDPLRDELARQRQELARAQARLLEHLRDLDDVRGRQQQAARQLADLAGPERELEQARDAVGRAAADQGQAGRQVAVTREERRQRGLSLAAEVQPLEHLPSAKKTLRYRTPVSRPVRAEEVLFECRRGRAAFIDVAAFLLEVRRGLDEKGKLLRNQWRVED